MRRPTLTLICAGLLALTVLGGGSAVGQPAPAGKPAATARAALPAATTGHHFVTNLHGAVDAPRRLGFNVFDTGASPAQVNALPDQVQALVWLGQKCPTPPDEAFRSTVRRLAANSKVFGYYLSDEPHIADCPQGPKALAGRAAFIAAASHGTQRSFVVLSRAEDYRPFRPAATGVSMVGLDPYPCSVAHPTCQVSKIDEKVGLALAAGIPRSAIVPVYQVFGQTGTGSASAYYYQPTADQLRAMLTRWASLVPSPPMDYAYGWGNQSSSNPTLVDSAPLQSVLTQYFAG